ncbi:MAG: hypothetical protein ACREJ6_01600 [Candidatus Methylomirabilis sp.]
MMKRQLVMSLVALALFLAHATAEGTGEIKGVTPTPKTITAGATVTIQIQGKDTCGALDLIFGDG